MQFLALMTNYDPKKPVGLGTKDSHGGLIYCNFGKKYRYLYRKYLVPEKSIGTGIV